MSTRVSAGIAAAGGRIGYAGDRCTEHGTTSSPSTENAIKIAYAGPGIDVEQLRKLGMEIVETDNPALIISSYAKQVNRQGGINGRCVEFLSREWDSDLSSSGMNRLSKDKACAEVRAFQPIIVLTRSIGDATLDCVTVEDRGGNSPDSKDVSESTELTVASTAIPVLAFFASAHDSAFVRAGERLLADQGSYSHLAAVSVDGALQAGMITSDDTVGLLHRSPTNSLNAQSIADAEIVTEVVNSVLERAGDNEIHEDVIAAVPASFDNAILATYETDVRLLMSRDRLDIEDTTTRKAISDRLESLDVPDIEEQIREIGRHLGDIEIFHLDVAERFKEAGVTAVVVSSEWQDVRRLMRAAQLINWKPKWIIDDSVSALLVMDDAPKQQTANLYQVSSRRAVGDAIPVLDMKCEILRNSDTANPPYTYGKHTDAWNLLSTTCDYLDVLFASIARIVADYTDEESLTSEDVLQSLRKMNYKTADGRTINFTADDHYGNDSFRVLRTDHACTLSKWGCMRAITDWYTPTVDLS